MKPGRYFKVYEVRARFGSSVMMKVMMDVDWDDQFAEQAVD